MMLSYSLAFLILVVLGVTMIKLEIVLQAWIGYWGSFEILLFKYVHIVIWGKERKL